MIRYLRPAVALTLAAYSGWLARALTARPDHELQCEVQRRRFNEDQTRQAMQKLDEKLRRIQERTRTCGPYCTGHPEEKT